MMRLERPKFSLSPQLAAFNPVVALKIITCLAAIFAIYYQDLQIIFSDALQNEATNQILLVLPLLAYIVYRKRKMLSAVVPVEQTDGPKVTQHFATLSGILLCTAAIIFYWYGSYTFTPLEYHILTLPIFAAGLILVLFNFGTLRQLAFPIAFLFFLIPIPEEILLGASSTLSTSSSAISFANVLGVPSTLSTVGQTPTIIITRPDNTLLGFSLDTACSGIYPLIGFIMFGVFVAFIIRDKPWKKATIFLLGIPLMYILNVLRITIVLLMGYHYGEQLALQTFHLFGGLALTVLGTVLLLTVAETVFKIQIFSRTTKTPQCGECQSPRNGIENYCHHCGRLLHYPKIKLRKTDIAKIVAILAAVSFLISIQAPVFALTQGPAQIIIQTPTGEQGNLQILPQTANYTLDFIFRDRDFENSSHQDASLIYLYTSQDPSRQNVWAGLEIAQQRSSLHGWEVCLLTWPQSHGYEPDVRQLDLKDIAILENPPIIARYFAFQYIDNNETQVVLYWYTTSTFLTNGTAEQKQVKISLIAYPTTPQEIQQTKNNLLLFASVIANYWEPTKTWTQIALTISKNGLTLTAITATLLTCIIIFNIVEAERNRRAKTRIYVKLPQEDQQIVDTVQKVEKKSPATSQNIAATLQNPDSIPLDLQSLNNKLFRAEQIGLISRRIFNKNDEPVETWKSNINGPVGSF
jgi:exosortase